MNTLLGLILIASSFATPKPRFRALVMYENGGHHVAYSKRALVWLAALAKEKSFEYDTVQSTDAIDDAFLAKYQVVIQLDFAPYGWKPQAVTAFERYVDDGKGGWVGFHHATLLGDFDGTKMWPWFSKFMGDIQYENYIPTFAKGTVIVEDTKHPVMKGVSPKFMVEKEEWYTYNRSPRPNVHVLASVDETTYRPGSTVKMGDHPVVWTNPHVKARNVYVFMGHDPILFDSKDYTTLFENAVLWAAGK